MYMYSRERETKNMLFMLIPLSIVSIGTIDTIYVKDR